MTTININDNLFNFKTNKPGKKSEKPKPGRSAKLHRTDEYWLKTRNAERRKQTKVRHDTHRHDEQPDAEDIRLEDIHFANFLGSKCEDGIPYNNVHIDEPVNLIECDSYLKPESSKNAPEEEQPEEEGEYINLEGYMDQRQIEREETAVAHLDLVYIPETKTLTSNGWYFKRGRDEEEEEQIAKRVRSDSYEITRMEEGLQEEANFDAMIDYMRQQVDLAQQMANEELYPCDCAHH
jgi:hypothetical protein